MINFNLIKDFDEENLLREYFRFLRVQVEKGKIGKEKGKDKIKLITQAVNHVLQNKNS